MRKFLVAVAAALVPSAAAAAIGWQRSAGEPLAVSATRFYLPASATTTIEGVSELRLAAIAAGASQTVRYRVEVVVQDSAGLELSRSQWVREMLGTVARTPGATAVESFGFAAAPGRYRVTVRAVPEAGVPVEREITVVAFSGRPAISDLLLATAVRRPAADSEALGPGEVRRGSLVMRTAPVPRLSMTEAGLSYYAEVYPWPGAAEEGELRADVVSSEGRTVVQATPRAVRVDSGGGLTRGTIDLAGLPVGEYRLRLAVQLGDSTVQAEAPFAMGGLVARPAVAATAPADLFETMSEGRLDSLFAPLVYLLNDRERGVYQRLGVDGKQRFMRDFWRRRDPTPETPDNPAMVTFYREVSYTNEAFREGGTGQIPGWRTDRGRIYLKNGRPDEVLRRPAGQPRPYEVWKYTRERQRYYVFLDQSGLGHYILLATNDRYETGRPEWERTLGPDAYDDVRRFIQ